MIKKILITGGACAGKTTSIEKIKEYLESKNYKVLVAKEAPTFLINSGFKPEKMGRKNFIKMVLEVQLNLKRYYDEYAKKGGNEVIILDGGPLDNMKFIPKFELENMMKDFNIKCDEILNWYDGIIHLETVAKTDLNMYNTESNPARTNNAEESVKRDDVLLDVYKNHKKRFVVKSNPNFDKKIKEVLDAVNKIMK